MLKVNLDKIKIEDDVIVVDKPSSWSSHDVVAKIRNDLSKKYDKKIKVGHGGTLDPFATGVLLILVGKATRRFEEIKMFDKEYIVEVELGIETDTGDNTGEIVNQKTVGQLEKTQVLAVLDSFKGKFEQEIPKFSAKKIGGKKMYELAREGKRIDKQTKKVQIKEIELVDIKGALVSIRVVCGSGTYMRQLAVDIGKKLGLPAHAKSLKRTRVGDYCL